MRATPANIQRATALVKRLMASIQLWKETDTIRARLPRSHAAKIPASRSRVVQGILNLLIRQRAVRSRSVQGLGALPAGAVVAIGAVVLIAGAAAVAAVIAAGAKITKEYRLAKDANARAKVVFQSWQTEEKEAKVIGPQAAAAKRKERIEQAGILFQSPAAEQQDKGAKKVEMPWWMIPALVAGGALLLFGGQKGSPYIRRRLG